MSDNKGKTSLKSNGDKQFILSNQCSEHENESMSGGLPADIDITVAILGHVSAGKTTLLNALLKESYGEVSMRKTTAGINYFRLKQNYAHPSFDNFDLIHRSLKFKEVSFRNAKSILNDITNLNAELRQHPRIQEKFFEVKLEECLLPMMKGTELVIVDVPGLNEAGTSKMYLDYVEKCWEKFDCVIIVIDSLQGVNTEEFTKEQISLLKLVEKNTKAKLPFPVIALCNKVDDPSNEETRILLGETQSEVYNVFQNTEKFDVRFVSISARNAFMFRATTNMTRDQFQQLDPNIIHSIGKGEFGQKWQKMSNDEKFNAIYEIINDNKEYQERMRNCNFGSFLDTLNDLIGEKVQKKIIQKQIMIEAETPISDAPSIELISILRKTKLIGSPPGLIQHITDVFWKKAEVYIKGKIRAFKKDPS